MSGGIEEMAEWEKARSKVDAIKTTDLVINDMRQRETMGYRKYGKYLSKNTDEDMLQHLYEELLDASMYIRTLIGQRNIK